MLLLLLHYLTVSHAFTITSPPKHQNVSPRRQTIRRLGVPSVAINRPSAWWLRSYVACAKQTHSYRLNRRSVR